MTAINFSTKSMSDLLTIYNDKAEMLDRPKVKRFADRKSAEARLTKILQASAGVSGQAAPQFIGNSAGEDAKEVKENEVALPKKTKTPNQKKAIVKRIKAEGEVVRKDSFRDKLLACMQRNIEKQVPISKLMEAVYGEARKDFKGPLMMVMKGLKSVIASNKMGLRIEKTRENKENHFGLYSTKK